jgi:hypothetical protein
MSSYNASVANHLGELAVSKVREATILMVEAAALMAESDRALGERTGSAEVLYFLVRNLLTEYGAEDPNQAYMDKVHRAKGKASVTAREIGALHR